MIYHVDVQTDSAVPEGIDKILELTLSETLAHRDYPAASLTLLLTDNKRIQQLNQDFRGENKPTDVLSFPAGDPVPGFKEKFPYLGDIAISVPVARSQAETSGHSLTAELQLLAIHGLLHLLGYDHVLPDDKVRMWSAQSKMLNLLGLPEIEPTEI